MSERKGTIGLGAVKVRDARITSVEKGNIGNVSIDKSLVAFTVKPEGFPKNVKALVKGDLAAAMYGNFLNAGKSMDTTLDCEDSDYVIKRSVTVDYDGDIREERANEVVIHNLRNVKFKFVYDLELAEEE